MRSLNLHDWDVTPKEAVSIQRELSRRVVLEWNGRGVSLLGAADVSFPSKSTVRAAVVVFTYPELEELESVEVQMECSFPYVPGLLAFREAPAVIEALEKLESSLDVLLLDGQGIAHPRRMGLATHVGLMMGLPTVGCAKSRLYGFFDDPGPKKGDFSYLLDSSGERIGAVLRTRDDTKPVFVSPGHLMDIEHSVSLVLGCSKKYRIPHPLREAHKRVSG